MALPTGYTEVQYIQSSGTQCIDTEFIPNQDTRIDVLTMPLSIADVSGIDGFTPYGAGESYNSRAFECYNANSQFEFNYGNSYGFLGSPTINSMVCISHNKNNIRLSIDGGAESTQSLTSNTFTAPRNLLLFAIGRASILYGKVRIYSCQIYDNGSLIRDYTPCINSDGEAGLYDTVNSKFYRNAGTGVFLAGPPRVSLPSGYTQLEYIQGTGNQYINTEFKPNQNTRLVADFEVLSWPSSQFLGARTGASNTAFNILVTNATSGRDDWNTSAISFTSGNARWKIDKNKNVTAINSSVTTHAAGTFTCPVPIYLFAVNNNGSLMATGCAGAKCYSCKLYDSSAPIRNFIPCSNPSGAIGLYDLVNSKFYPNAGTGVFTAGPEVTWPSNNAIYVKVNGIWRQIDGIKLL